MTRAAEAPPVEKLDAISFDDLLRRENPFDGCNLRFDLTGVRLVTPAAMVLLASACYALAEMGQRAVIAVDDDSVRSYLARAGLVAVVMDVADIEPEIGFIAAHGFDHRFGAAPTLIEVTRVEDYLSLPDVLGRIVDVLYDELGYHRRDALAIATGVSEVSQNSFEHNSGVCAFLAMQVYGYGQNRFLEIGIADHGDGLKATLRRNSKNSRILSDRDAVRRATEFGVSAYDDPTRGTGLYHLLGIAYRHAGCVQIRSGVAAARYRADIPDEWVLSVPWMPGVQVAITLPAQTPI